VLVEGERLEVLAAAGDGRRRRLSRRAARGRSPGSIFESVSQGRTVYRRDMPTAPSRGGRAARARPALAADARRCSSARPAVGLISFSPPRADAFTPEEVELVSLIGRLAGDGVQNIRAYDAEHRTVEELRRLSALRADFVSLVSHELRSPMAAVIGAAQTLQQRWRELSPEQRASFLALIADETSRLADLIADVLDTSRIEAGTFTYRFDDLDVGELTEEAVASASLGQDEVPDPRRRAQAAAGRARRPRRACARFCRNLIENAVKCRTRASVDVEVVAIERQRRRRVRDRGPGIPRDEQRRHLREVRPREGRRRPAARGLGLFIARSIAEAHGGTVDVRSVPGGRDLHPHAAYRG
jgi:K+-sensing histidine kinase KdpD